MGFLFYLLLFLAPEAFAGRAVCELGSVPENSPFAQFAGGKILIDTENANTTIFAADPVRGQRQELITNQIVSTFGIARAACNHARETILRSDGSLRALLFRFANCRSPEPVGYVRAEVEFDLTANFGAYREILLTPSGRPPSNSLRFSHCTLQR